MNKRIKKLFAAVRDNQIIAIGTTAMDFYHSFTGATGYKLGYHTFRKYLKDVNHYPVTIEGRDYFFQRVK